MPNVPENLKKFFKQIQKLYERDTEFQIELDNIIENSQVCVKYYINMFEKKTNNNNRLLYYYYHILI